MMHRARGPECPRGADGYSRVCTWVIICAPPLFPSGELFLGWLRGHVSFFVCLFFLLVSPELAGILDGELKQNHLDFDFGNQLLWLFY